ncbi:MAG: hypothetical protein QOG83_3654 [Alphaproteobacteria bacterium]|jgi:hypothetical protein|nr:hypothetical protein [Alphaproteobacteria bacterium]
MHVPGSIGAFAFAALLMACAGAQAHDQSKYPDLSGQWHRDGRPRWVAEGQKPPLTPEYMKIFEDNLEDMGHGGQGDMTSWYCLPQGMPMMMNIYDPMELVVTPATTYLLISHVNDSYRRIYTDGRAWPEDPEPNFVGYSIGKWIDEDGDGRYDALEVETRHLRGPRVYDSTGIPMHKDNKTVIKERFYLDKSDPEVLFIDITVFDNALTKPWSMKKKARRDPSPQPVWRSEVCAADNSLARIGKEAYFMSADGYLMPTRKGQKPPDARYFESPPK